MTDLVNKCINSNLADSDSQKIGRVPCQKYKGLSRTALSLVSTLYSHDYNVAFERTSRVWILSPNKDVTINNK